MTVFNFGSINVDRFYQVHHLPAPGETLSAFGHSEGLGGKGANQSVAAARAGARAVHIGAVGPDGDWTKDRLAGFGVDTTHIATLDSPMAHAVIYVDQDGENSIVIYPGTNLEQTLFHLESALLAIGPEDVLLLQNEVNLTPEAARIARANGAFVIYSAAPFDDEAAAEMLPHIDLLVLNEVEAEQLAESLEHPVEELEVPQVLITLGAKGARWRNHVTGESVEMPAFPVVPVDTTGAGDCFIGTVAAGLDLGLTMQEAMRLGTAASALKVTRHGTADAMPTRDEIDAFLAELETK